VVLLPLDHVATKQAIELVRQGMPSEATTLGRSIGDPVAQTLVEWALQRHAESTAGFTRYAAFIHQSRLAGHCATASARRGEAVAGAAMPPSCTNLSARRRRAGLAGSRSRVLAAEGDRVGAEREARAAWQSAPLSADLETATLDAFRDVLTRSDHRARMNRK
jgi:soluble lytic murein transglycosylase